MSFKGRQYNEIKELLESLGFMIREQDDDDSTIMFFNRTPTRNISKADLINILVTMSGDSEYGMFNIKTTYCSNYLTDEKYLGDVAIFLAYVNNEESFTTASFDSEDYTIAIDTTIATNKEISKELIPIYLRRHINVASALANGIIALSMGYSTPLDEFNKYMENIRIINEEDNE